MADRSGNPQFKALIIAANAENAFNFRLQDIIEPDQDVMAIGSGGAYALAAAKPFLRTHSFRLVDRSGSIENCCGYLRIH